MRWTRILPAAWLLFTFSLAAWWLLFGLHQIRRIGELNHELSDAVMRQHRMLLGEGIALLLVILMGGAALIYYSWREERRRLEMQSFLSGFTHELKTSLASLRLQSEVLLEEEPSSPRLTRLLREIVRLELQLDNALFLARPSESKLHLEKISIADLIDQLRPLWPDLSISLQDNAQVSADRRALESVVKNIIQNSYHHGEAKHVVIGTEVEGAIVTLHIRDDGSGFQGNWALLGKAFVRQNGRSGSGLGLHLSHELLRKMRGSLQPVRTDKGFAVDVRLESWT